MMMRPTNGDGMVGALPISGLYFRKFGLWGDDLKVDFGQSNRPELVTQLLLCCSLYADGTSPPADLFWESSVGKRIQCLLAISLGGRPRVTFRLQCKEKACGESMEMEITLEEIASLQSRSDSVTHIDVSIGGEVVRLRKPKGSDQRAILQKPCETIREIKTSVMATLLSEEENGGLKESLLITDELWAAVNEAMDEADPLVNPSFSVTCPCCGKQGQHSINLESRALERLETAQNELIQAIHCLAKHYHWTEAEIFSIPPRRRAMYLGLIKGENPS